MVNLHAGWLRFLLITFISVSSTAAAQSAVTDIDMKTIYCVRLKVKARNLVQPLLQHFETLHPGTPQVQAMKNEFSRLDNDIKRLQAYATARAHIVGPVAYAQAASTAANRSDEDLASSDRCTKECGDMTNKDGSTNFSKVNACETACSKKISDVLSRLRSCDVVNWLPF